MPDLYVANTSNQKQLIHYRLDYDKGGNMQELRKFRLASQQPIDPGRQVVLGPRGAHMTQIEDIVSQLRPFGLIGVSDVATLNTPYKVPYVFNVGAPVPSDVMRLVQAHNDRTMRLEGKDRRKKAAVATNETVQNTVENQFLEQGIPAKPADSTEVVIEEEETEDRAAAGHSRIQEGFEVVPEGKVGPKSGRPAAEGKRPRGRPRKGS